MRKWINLCENTHPSISEIVTQVRDRWISEGYSVASIQDGNCFEFADSVVQMTEEVGYPTGEFFTAALGSFFKYEGQYNDDPVGFDEQLLHTHWSKWHPIPNTTWQQMYEKGFDWDGIHGWVVNKNTQMCYDVVNVNGVQNFWELHFFKPYVDDVINN
jgi:hypothetical protein